MSGLLINGKLWPVAGLTIVPPASAGGPAWAALSAGDYRARTTTWVRQIVVHTTKGQWPQHVTPGAGPNGSGKVVADFWRGDPAHSAAQLVVDQDGTVVCLCDLGRDQAYHAEGSNPWSVGIEMYQLGDGGIHEATLSATVALVSALTEIGGLFDIPAQVPRGPYPNRPTQRMELGAGAARANIGAPNLVGVVGHRDNTSERGRGDPGDEIFVRLIAAGFEPLDYDQLEDITTSTGRQAALNARGEQLVIDGVCGAASIAAMRRHGFARWRDVV